MTRFLVRSMFLATMAMLVSSCAGRDLNYEPPSLPSQVGDRDERFVEGQAKAFASSPLPARWWRLYADRRLDALVEEALAANYDLRAASANIDRASAAVDEVRAGAGPATTIGASGSLGETSSLGIGQPSGAHGLFDAGIAISYQIDVAGRIRHALEAAQANADAQIAAHDVARATVVAGVVAAYGDVCAYGARMAVARRSIELQRQSLALTERGIRSGIYMPLEAVRSRALVAQLEAAVPPLESGRRAALYALAALLGRAPRDFPADLEYCDRIPSIVQILPVGDGHALIQRRPDVREAERNVAATSAQLGVAIADLYPSISLGASLGSTARSVTGLANESAFRFSLGPLLSWTFPNRSIARARIAQADAAKRAAIARFDSTVLTALRETEVALGTYARDLEQGEQLAVAREENRKAASMQARLTRGGLGSALERIDAERSLSAAESAFAQAQAVIAQDRVRLFLALGGGWERE